MKEKQFEFGGREEKRREAKRSDEKKNETLNG